ncbi:T9SS type A sorting domain-containing protein [Flavobacterium algicola]|uniref:T9SS type A sorting domain-containing protein n=1 Tax=Flavobacterium algicola TaxID=556529 RepID=UPI001EFE134A|nr:T9SS type A sorting domain-containing protein [Flavobacterium algicola]MCG9793544.1 T9SS type A sorting domain-containing protein [Flavobacterium algicola]
MKRAIFIIILLATTKCLSQIYFSPNASMYVKDEVIFVNQYVNLDSNSNFYLRNNAQLVQGSTGSSSNTGIGKLSVYQEGNSDNFDYNYWCSPVGLPALSVGNGNFGITLLNQPTSAIASSPAVALASIIDDGFSNPLSIATRWIYKLSSDQGYSGWNFVGDANSIITGEGFTMKGTSGTDLIDPEGNGIPNNSGSAQRYDFRGKPNDGTITLNIDANSVLLTGNPYPSALHLNAFLLDADNNLTGGVAYFWEQDRTADSHYLEDYRGGYGAYSPVNLASNGVYVPATFDSYNSDGSLNMVGLSSGLIIERKYTPIGQGFIVTSLTTGTVKFKNSHRSYYKEYGSLSQFQKQVKAISKTSKSSSSLQESTEVSHIKINAIINNQVTRQLALVFSPEATDGIDFGIDAPNYNLKVPNDVHFYIGNENYVIEGINFDVAKSVPLIITADAPASFNFYIPEVVNFDTNQQIYLYDAVEKSYHNIKNGNYQLNLDAGVYQDRFKITFDDQATLGTENSISQGLVIIQDNKNNNLVVHNPQEADLQLLKIYDLSGKAVLAKKSLGTATHYSLSTSTLNSGMYMVKITSVDNNTSTQKIIISRFNN